MSIESLPLNNGVQIPVLGLGVYQSQPGEETYRAVYSALELGYRHIDTAALYGNEADVGRAIRDAMHNLGLKRSEIFVTTKLWNDDQGPRRTPQAFEKSLKNLGLEYIDLYLIHWPVHSLRNFSWKEMEKLYQQGRSRAIGVSNYMPQHLRELLKIAEVPPAVNQVEFSPYLYQRELLAFCQEHQIQLEAYSPLTRGTRLQDPRLRSYAAKYHKSPAQILIRWCLQHGVVCLPKSVHSERIRENAEVFDFQLSSRDLEALDGHNENLHTCWDPTYAP